MEKVDKSQAHAGLECLPPTSPAGYCTEVAVPERADCDLVTHSDNFLQNAAGARRKRQQYCRLFRRHRLERPGTCDVARGLLLRVRLAR